MNDLETLKRAAELNGKAALFLVVAAAGVVIAIALIGATIEFVRGLFK